MWLHVNYVYHSIYIERERLAALLPSPSPFLILVLLGFQNDLTSSRLSAPPFDSPAVEVSDKALETACREEAQEGQEWQANMASRKGKSALPPSFS
jgi:hypothetical protein